MNTLISEIQGSGLASSMVGQTVTVEARVTAWLPQLNMFFVQEESTDHDGNTATSEGIAVFYTAGASPLDASSVGDIVQLTAVVSESNGLTQLNSISAFSQIIDGSAADIEPAVRVTLPVADANTLEQYEGMLIQIESASGNPLYVGDTFTYARFGEFTLHADAVPMQYTQTNLPDVAGNAAYNDFLASNKIQIEDMSNRQNSSFAQINDGPLTRNGSELSSENFIRVGDTVQSVTGVLGYSFGAYELQPVQGLDLVGAARPVAPDEAAINANGTAEVRVASFNVLNYFTDFAVAGTTTDNFSTPDGVVHEPRGADSLAEFERQQLKVVNAIIGTNADVLGLMEIQNNGFGNEASAIDDLVDALNDQAGAGVYDYIRAPYSNGTGTAATAGTDAIMVAIIYKPSVMQPLGAAVIPDSVTYTAFQDSHRVPVAQTFGYTSDSSKQFTLVVNHFKSKGSVSNNFAGDADSGDGQGNNNPSRLQAAVELSLWLETNPTGASDGDYLVLGDLNSYRMEDPIRYLTDNTFNSSLNYGGYDIPAMAESLAGSYSYVGSESDYGYVFNGLRGSLDHAIARGLQSEITGVDHWHINADEQIAMDYNLNFSTADFFAPGPYRASDHDPVIIGLALNSEAGSPVTPEPDTTAPTLLSSSPTDDADAVVNQPVIELNFSEGVQKGSGSITLENLSGGANRVIDILDSQVSVAGSTIRVQLAQPLDQGATYAVTVSETAVTDLSNNPFAGIANQNQLNFTVARAPSSSAVPDVFINEIHYDNAGTDTGEAIAIAGVAGLSLSGWSLVLYNGNGGQSYLTTNLSGTFTDQQNGYGELAFNYPSNGIQNGSPDGIALVNASGQVVQFISYEGVMTATNGPANGMTSIDIGVAEAGTEAAGLSLQVIEAKADGSFVWSTARNSSFGSINNTQIIASVPTFSEFVGTASDDFISGSSAADRMIGLTGNDSYLIDNADDLVVEAFNAGVDRLISTTLSLDLQQHLNVENALLQGSADLNLNGNSLDNLLIGQLGRNMLSGQAGNDMLYGGGGNDTLYGGDGNDLLDGQFGIDVMHGGRGDDVYFINNRLDQVVELSNEGNDLIHSAVDIDLTKFAHVENATLTAAGLVARGSVVNNTLTAHAGGSTLFGGGGDDTLNGAAGNDILDGGWGSDLLRGGMGDDVYFTNGRGDVVVELADQGVDTVNSSVNWDLADNLENLNLLGSANIYAKGNSLNNVLTGNGGDNLLDANGGSDRLIGGAGSDTYLLQRDHGQSVVVELLGDSGADTIQLGVGVRSNQLWFSRVGDDLQATIIGTEASLVVEDWYSAGMSVESFRLQNGSTLAAADVENLVSAMAMFDAPSMGMTSLTAQQNAALGGVINSSWLSSAS